MNLATLKEELKQQLCTLLEIDDLNEGDHFVRDLRADSMLLEEAVVVIEKRYAIQLPADKLKDVRCLRDLQQVVAGVLGVR